MYGEYEDDDERDDSGDDAKSDVDEKEDDAMSRNDKKTKNKKADIDVEAYLDEHPDIRQQMKETIPLGSIATDGDNDGSKKTSQRVDSSPKDGTKRTKKGQSSSSHRGTIGNGKKTREGQSAKKRKQKTRVRGGEKDDGKDDEQQTEKGGDENEEGDEKESGSDVDGSDADEGEEEDEESMAASAKTTETKGSKKKEKKDDTSSDESDDDDDDEMTKREKLMQEIKDYRKVIVNGPIPDIRFESRVLKRIRDFYADQYQTEFWVGILGMGYCMLIGRIADANERWDPLGKIFGFSLKLQGA